MPNNLVEMELENVYIVNTENVPVIVRSEEKDGVKTHYAKMQVFPYGEYVLNYGSNLVFKYDEAFADEMIKSFYDNIVGQDIPVDVDHRFDVAYGWIIRDEELRKNLFKEADGLYAMVKLNDTGYRMLTGENYRYTSMAYCTIYMNSRTKAIGKNVLISLAVTNYPALKGIKPVQVFNYFKKGDNKMSETKDMQKEVMQLQNDALTLAQKEIVRKESEIKSYNENNAKLLSEIQRLQQEVEQFKLKEKHASYVKLLSDFRPREGVSTYKLNETSYEVCLNYMNTLNDSVQVDAFMKVLSSLPEHNVPVTTPTAAVSPETVHKSEGVSTEHLEDAAYASAEKHSDWHNVSHPDINAIRWNILNQERNKLGLQ